MMKKIAILIGSVLISTIAMASYNPLPIFSPSGINWSDNTLIHAGINWDTIKNLGTIGINWNNEVFNTVGINWDSTKNFGTNGINWNSLIFNKAQMNWQSITQLASQNINWNGNVFNTFGLNWTNYKDIGAQTINWYDITQIARGASFGTGISPTTALQAGGATSTNQFGIYDTQYPSYWNFQATYYFDNDDLFLLGSTNATGNKSAGFMFTTGGGLSIGTYGSTNGASDPPNGGMLIQTSLSVGTANHTSTIQVGGACAAIGPVGTCWTSTGQLGYCSGAGGICTSCTAC